MTASMNPNISKFMNCDCFNEIVIFMFKGFESINETMKCKNLWIRDVLLKPWIVKNYELWKPRNVCLMNHAFFKETMKCQT